MKYDLSGKIVKNADVPCGNCHACCERDLIFLHPECGDIIDDYEHEPAPKPFEGRFILRHSLNGDCYYLGLNGCVIHGKAPAICREFDCREFARSLGYTQARKMKKRGIISAKILNIGKRLLKEK